MHFLKYFLLNILLIFLPFHSANASNIVTYVVSDSVATSTDKLNIEFDSLSNKDDKVRISFNLKCANVPFTIYDAKWVNCDSTLSPSEPFTLIADAHEVSGKSTEWRISLDFPFSDTFEDSDVLILTTDKGIVKCRTSVSGKLKEDMIFFAQIMKTDLICLKRVPGKLGFIYI